MARTHGKEHSQAPPENGVPIDFGQLLDHVRDAVVIADADGRIVLWNAAATQMFGYEPSEIMGRDVALLVPERLRARHMAGMARFRDTGTGPLLEEGGILELPALTKSGGEIIVEFTLSRVGDAGGHVMAIIRDVTERVRLHEAIDADRRRLRDANETLESFSYVVGHDLKEPVRAVDVYLEALDEEVRDPETRALIARARDATSRMRALLDGLIEWGRATMTQLDVGETDLREVIESGPCRARFQAIAREREAHVEIAESIPPVLASEQLVCQIFGNVILNAIRHNPREKPRVTVALAGGDADRLCIAVRDNGRGFSPEVRQRVERMRATRPTTVRGGFGMTIAMRAAHLLGGRLELGDAPGGGGEVRVWLPRAR